MGPAFGECCGMRGGGGVGTVKLFLSLPLPFSYPCSKDGIDDISWQIWIYNSLCCLATVQSLCLMMIRRDGGLNTLCHICGFASEKRVQKTFAGPSNLRSEAGIVYL